MAQITAHGVFVSVPINCKNQESPNSKMLDSITSETSSTGKSSDIMKVSLVKKFLIISSACLVSMLIYIEIASQKMHFDSIGNGPSFLRISKRWSVSQM